MKDYCILPDWIFSGSTWLINPENWKRGVLQKQLMIHNSVIMEQGKPRLWPGWWEIHLTALPLETFMSQNHKKDGTGGIRLRMDRPKFSPLNCRAMGKLGWIIEIKFPVLPCRFCTHSLLPFLAPTKCSRSHSVCQPICDICEFFKQSSSMSS